MRTPFRAGISLALQALAVILLILFRPHSTVAEQGAQVSRTALIPKLVAFRNSVPGVAYVGSKVCAACHADIYDEFVRSGMGRSMSMAGEKSQLDRVSSATTVEDKKIGRYFRVGRDGSNLYQSEYGLDAGGLEVSKHTEKLAYAIGSGVVGTTYVIQRGNYLFQAPLSFYTQPHAWELSPGYEFQDYGFARPILAQCVACHSGARAASGKTGGLPSSPFDAEPFEVSPARLEEPAIGCENCHGPGHLHVEEREKGTPLSGNMDSAIVNPAKLPAWLANNICMFCHQAGDARVMKPGKNLFDFRPGTPLDDTLAIFQVPLSRTSPPPSPLLGHYYGMILSKCYLASSGRLSCLSCHDPHQQPLAAEAPAYFRNKCLSCHTEKSCKLALAPRLRENPPDNCAGCHMRRRDLTVISHAALTDHRITALEREPYPEAAFRQTVADLPDLVHISRVPGSREPIPALTLLEAYAQLTPSNPRIYQVRYLAALDQAAKAEPENLFVLSALAQKALWEDKQGGETKAIEYLERAVNSGSTYPADYMRLAELLARAGRKAESAAVLERGLRIAPYNNQFYQLLAVRYISLQKNNAALEIMKRGLELFPEDTALRQLLNRIETGSAPAAP